MVEGGSVLPYRKGGEIVGGGGAWGNMYFKFRLMLLRIMIRSQRAVVKCRLKSLIEEFSYVVALDIHYQQLA